MGKYFTDQYSLIHFASGMIAQFIGLKLITWFVLHFIFEIVANTQAGMNIINKYLVSSFWPGGKDEPDTFVNSKLGDNFYALLGWIDAYYSTIQSITIKQENIKKIHEEKKKGLHKKIIKILL